MRCLIVLLFALCCSLLGAARPSFPSINCQNFDWVAVLGNCNDTFTDGVNSTVVGYCGQSEGDLVQFGEMISYNWLPDGRSNLDIPDIDGDYYSIIFIPDRCLVAFSIDSWQFNVLWPGSDQSVNPKRHGDAALRWEAKLRAQIPFGRIDCDDAVCRWQIGV